MGKHDCCNMLDVFEVFGATAAESRGLLDPESVAFECEKRAGSFRLCPQKKIINFVDVIVAHLGL